MEMIKSPMINEIVQKIRTAFRPDDASIALHEPYFGGNEWAYVKECLDTGWVSSVGKFVDRFERDLTSLTGAKYAIATVNGTAALHIAYLLADIKRHDEVLVPTLTFIGTINPITYCGAIPHFIDSDEKTLGIDPVVLDDYLKSITIIKNNVCFNRFTDRPIKALCVMHTLGHSVDLDGLYEVCERYHLHLIEDAAEALGTYYKGTHVGHRGLIGALSFNGNKVVTTGGGGAILTNHASIAKLAKHMTTTAKLQHPWLFEHDHVGYNYRLPNINAALGCAQLEQLTHFIDIKRQIAERYRAIFNSVVGIRFVTEPNYGKSNYWLNAILLDEPSVSLQSALLTALKENGIMCRPLWNLQHTLPMFSDAPRMPLPVAENLQRRLIKLPSSVNLCKF